MKISRSFRRKRSVKASIWLIWSRCAMRFGVNVHSKVKSCRKILSDWMNAPPASLTANPNFGNG